MTLTRRDISMKLLSKGKNKDYIAGYFNGIEGYETQDPKGLNKDYSKGYSDGKYNR
jgi:hypothetical protein